jgi:hypothetical protein
VKEYNDGMVGEKKKKAKAVAIDPDQQRIKAMKAEIFAINRKRKVLQFIKIVHEDTRVNQRCFTVGDGDGRTLHFTKAEFGSILEVLRKEFCQ